MKTINLISGIMIGLFFTLFLFQAIGHYQQKKLASECQSELESSECEEAYAKLSSSHKVETEAKKASIDYIIEKQERESFLSHIESCYINKTGDEKDSCILKFVLDTREFEACGLINNYHLLKSCIALKDKQ